MYFLGLKVYTLLTFGNVINVNAETFSSLYAKIFTNNSAETSGRNYGCVFFSVNGCIVLSRIYITFFSSKIVRIAIRESFEVFTIESSVFNIIIFEESYIADYSNGRRNRGSTNFCGDFYGAFFVCYRIVVLNSDLNKGEVGIGFRNISGSSTSFIEDIANCGNVCIRSNTIGNSAIFSNIRPTFFTVGIGSFIWFCCINNSKEWNLQEHRQ